MNDDAAMTTNYWRMRAERLLQLREYLDYGLISFAINGGVGNPEQRQSLTTMDAPAVLEATKTLCFVAVLVRRTAWDVVGPMDERFTFYGLDDDDMCRRMHLAGWKCGVTQKIVVTHGMDGRPHSSSYLKYHSQAEADAMFHKNKQIYVDKWGGMPGQETLTVRTRGCVRHPYLSQCECPERVK
jgi:GT2 family glycosyltransferase